MEAYHPFRAVAAEAEAEAYHPFQEVAEEEAAAYRPFQVVAEEVEAYHPSQEVEAEEGLILALRKDSQRPCWAERLSTSPTDCSRPPAPTCARLVTRVVPLSCSHSHPS